MARYYPGVSGNNLNVGDVAAADITVATFTIAAWVHHEPTGLAKSVVTKWQSGGAAGTQAYELLVLNTGPLQTNVRDAGGTATTVNGVATVPVGWQHVAVRSLGTGANDLQVLLNGAVDNSGQGRAPRNATSALRFGEENAGATNPFPMKGSIAEVAIWTINLSDAEMTRLIAGDSPLDIQAGSLQGYWPCCGTDSPEPDLKKQNAATINGTVVASSHPPIPSICENEIVQQRAGWPRFIR